MLKTAENISKNYVINSGVKKVKKDICMQVTFENGDMYEPK